MVSTYKLLIKPNTTNKDLIESVSGVDQNGHDVSTSVSVERPLTLFLNGQEIVTMMSICDYPDFLAVGYLLNQNMLSADEKILSIDYEKDIETIVVRTNTKTNFEEKLKKKTLTSGCAQGTVFGDLMEEFNAVRLNRDLKIKTSELYALIKKVNTTPSL